MGATRAAILALALGTGCATKPLPDLYGAVMAETGRALRVAQNAPTLYGQGHLDVWQEAPQCHGYRQWQSICATWAPAFSVWSGVSGLGSLATTDERVRWASGLAVVVTAGLAAAAGACVAANQSAYVAECIPPPLSPAEAEEK